MTDQPTVAPSTDAPPPPPLPPQMLGYAPPLTLGYAQPPGHVVGGQWQEGNRLVTHVNASFLPCCVKCGAESDGRIWKKQYAWHHPGIYAVILANLIIYAIVAMAVQKKMTVNLYLCAAHRAKRTKGLWITWLLSLGGIATFITGIVIASNARRSEEWIGVLILCVGLAVIIAAIIVGNVMVPILKPRKITREYAWFSGVGPEYLRQLPEARPQ